MYSLQLIIVLVILPIIYCRNSVNMCMDRCRRTLIACENEFLSTSGECNVHESVCRRSCRVRGNMQGSYDEQSTCLAKCDTNHVICESVAEGLSESIACSSHRTQCQSNCYERKRKQDTKDKLECKRGCVDDYFLCTQNAGARQANKFSCTSVNIGCKNSC